MTASDKPIASLSLDLDNQWSYMKTHGGTAWQTFPSYLDVVVPRALRFLEERGLTITFFIVGQDAERAENRPALSAITAAGHEVGNHSFHHEPWLHLYSDADIEAEIARAERAIEEATGRRPEGFRGPGFSISRAVLATLKRRGYRYDASTFPTFLGPLARAYYFFTARLSKEEREQRKALFGGLREGLRPLRPYSWRLSEGTLIEVPVTTMPIFRAPFHVSYLTYLAGYSPALARFYFAMALQLCRWTGVQPSLLLHPLDFLGVDDGIEPLNFFPGMNIPAATKLAWLDGFISVYTRWFHVLPMGRHVDLLGTMKRMREFEPDFSADRGEPIHAVG
ncbi:MAG: polysaccharide deacetylase family protein [Rhodospirillales bacterium]|nr:polysaccharide deacetylase family protein [Rhodospirillales bacterium]